MSKKHWITVKRGLSEDPKHRESMGMSIWGFLHMVDRADWETGKVFDWRDKDEAEDMGVNERTLRDWRQRLTDSGYIACSQKQRGIEITIFNWINPRDYSAGVLNQKSEGDTKVDILVSPSEIQGDTKVDTQGDTKVRGENVTLPLDSNIKESPSPDEMRKILDSSNRKVDAILEIAKKATYQNRDKIPEPYLEYCDTYNRLTGQEPRKDVIQGWLMTFSEWQSAGVRPLHIEAAYDRSERGLKFPVVRPGSLTNTVMAIKGASVSEPVRSKPEHKIFHASENPEPKYSKPPEGLRGKIHQTVAGVAAKLEEEAHKRSETE
jgi:hypothetical protein